MRAILLALICAVGGVPLAGKEKPAVVYSIPLPPRADFAALDWLVGEWAGKTTERSAPGEVRLSVALDLDKQFMILRGEVSLPATKSAPAARESWIGILSPDREGSGFVLRSFSSTGFISRYRVTVEGPEIRFSPEGGENPPPGWLFRRVIARAGTGELIETVQVAPPTRPFFDYYIARLSRVTPTAKTSAAP
jgi:hypothetical protein